MASTLLSHVRAARGEQGVDELLSATGLDYSADYLGDVANWIWYDEAIALFEGAAKLTGEDDIGQRVGEETVRQHAGTPVATLLRSLGSPQAIYEQLADSVTKFSTVTELVPTEVVPGRAILLAKARPGFKRHRHLCAWTKGMMSQPPVLFGLPPATVEETSCEVRGDDHCLYEIAWDADRAASAADPQELVTALEAQLMAMNDRLENVYATAQDLIAFDDVEAALARITERAATAVRAPKYLLAVRAGPERELHVHHRGFLDEDPEAAARALLEGGGDDQTDVQLVVEVESRARHYGRLMASWPSGGFLPQERAIFAVYARYAASVLDTATALDDARREHRHSRALLDLSRAVARVTRGGEVAQRLVDAVPAVVDCDRVAVFLRSGREEALTCRAVTDAVGGGSEILRELRLRTDTTLLAEIVDSNEPRPRFLDPETPDRFFGQTMERLGSKRLVIVPIVANNRFYGVLTISVTERPERLQPSAALNESLAGIVSQAATALDNAAMIETMAHQASHDGLTGLLGHRAFHEALEQEVGGDDTGVFTLALLDIDDFKQVNDLHGHPVGDQALKRVAQALRRGVRDHDAIFRVGGEEFAVLLKGLGSEDALAVAERLRGAVARTVFVLPLRVSVGLATWPADSADREGLLERADAALYAAKAAGKDCTRVAGMDERDAGAPQPMPQELRKLLRDKGDETLAHSARVATLSVEIGHALGLEGERLADLRLAAQLHDLGMVAVPDETLLKQGPLDEDEVSVIRTHPLVGAVMLGAWGLSRVGRFVHEHHERVDGRGYPVGLSGEDISLEARIIHTAAAYSAMTTDRPYRPALDGDAALAEIRRLRGAQFDAEVVAALEARLVSHESTPTATQQAT